MQDYRDLKVWSEAREMVKAVYLFSKSFPDEEKFGLTSQMRRTAVSIAANIAEGAAQNTNPQFHRFLTIAYASASEVTCLIQLAQDLEFGSSQQCEKIDTGVRKIQKMLFGLMQRVGGDQPPSV
jgi:four helix bundle protein